MTRKPPLILGIVVAIVAGAGCQQQQTTKIADLDPYVGHYPSGARPLPPKQQPPPPPKQTGGSLKGATIVVDAGHGGHDPGARGLSATAEKQINLNIAMDLARLLQSRGAKVVTTRNGDHFVELDDRAATADSTHADLFVSIHADSSKKSGISGTTVYISRTPSAQSSHAAQCIASALERAGIECRGVHGAGYRVLVGHSRPAVLVECGFLTNRADAQRLNNSGFQSKMAEAIAEGIAQHFSG
ncbi:MAG TPA: N-acetylmuramoyl-L-alanine amidase [Phycisphaerae bacterium]|nr:N-acetylmuramoyl-L-alanine amidase [Phycisphaerae bacterium]